MQSSKRRAIITAMTGASGAAYGLRLIQRLAEAGVEQHLLLSRAARVVLKQETDIDLPEATSQTVTALAEQLNIPGKYLHNYALEDWFSPAASGSAGIKQMVIIPCSMGTMARIAGGMSDNLIERAADVILKEKRQLIIVPRETPLSSIHLENMLKLSHMGTHIIPAMPGFYHKPETLDEIIDFIVDRVLDHLDLSNPEAKKWGS
ncbi:MAG: aromatic acid decarboxylase [Zetaproteobacteria bacterium CG1_02_53_45]|nr:MAG: aromatic acid decarboxylase [Zetaproteobacteria bacterium CG1_02_53_45]